MPKQNRLSFITSPEKVQFPGTQRRIVLINGYQHSVFKSLSYLFPILQIDRKIHLTGLKLFVVQMVIPDQLIKLVVGHEAATLKQIISYSGVKFIDMQNQEDFIPDFSEQLVSIGGTEKNVLKAIIRILGIIYDNKVYQYFQERDPSVLGEQTWLLKVINENQVAKQLLGSENVKYEYFAQISQKEASCVIGKAGRGVKAMQQYAQGVTVDVQQQESGAKLHIIGNYKQVQRAVAFSQFLMNQWYFTANDQQRIQTE
eukprot:TRINITY_DN7124_c0_g1_i2.p1 TRINITY_DN7124_c0_g1~~TRINITY_DN7124_c0_g1_i2.p1  ORF type:complete len:257 (-),score=19.54 TRINITY_DN7124_c0_g1_i2:318-1088(-)